MYSVDLFLGFEKSEAFRKSLLAANPHLIQTFINNESIYLQQTTLGDKTYIGKFIGQSCSLKQIELLLSNIKSLVKRISPDYPIEEEQILLLSQKKDCE